MCGLAQVIPDVMDQTSTCWLGTEVWRRRSCPRHMTVALNCEVRPKIAIELLQKGNVNINVSVRPIWPISRNLQVRYSYENCQVSVRWKQCNKQDNGERRLFTNIPEDTKHRKQQKQLLYKLAAQTDRKSLIITVVGRTKALQCEQDSKEINSSLS
ncbi:hypothetical protein AVEN_219263-1, partial [Araneus ventricosus]